MAKNSSSNFSCTDIKTDLTQKDYLGYVATCANTFSSNQANEIKYCGPMNDIIQENSIKSINECINSNVVTKQMEAVATTSTSSNIETTQEATGLDLAASLGSLASISPIISIIVSVAICCLLLVSIVLMTMNSPKK
jgi:hypothetical protein